MGFITELDYRSLIKDGILMQVLDNDLTIAGDAELFAQQEIESYLNQRYDVATIFAATGTSRNSLLLMYMIDCVLYHIHARINPNKVPEIRILRYDKAIKWLEMVSAGKLTPALPLRTNVDTGDIDVVKSRTGSNPKFNNQF